MRPADYQLGSSLRRHQPKTLMDEEDLRRAAKAAWREHGKVIVSPSDADLTDLERAWVRSIGIRRHGAERR